MPEVELVGDIYHILDPPGRGVPARAAPGRLARACASVVLGRFEAAKDDDAFPMQPPRAL